MATDRQLLKAWSRVCAFAWTQTTNGSNVLQNLRQDPKNTVTELAKGTHGKYNADSDTANRAQVIIDFSQDPEATYSGYLPIPQAMGGLGELSEENLRVLLQAGITGTMRFDDQPQEWAKVFHAAWKDPELLNAIRKDPLTNLPRVNGLNLQELQKSKYGILPFPDLSSGLSEVTVEQLENINFESHHAGGIVPFGS